MIHSANAFDKYNIEIPKETKQYLFAFSTLLLTLLIIYGNSFHNSWHYDDYVNIVENESIHIDRLTWEALEEAAFGTHRDSGKLKRPLSYLTLGLNHYFGKDNVFGYHLVNFIIHYLTSITLFVVIRNTLKLPLIRCKYESTGYAIALIATFLWATHPIQVSAVTYIVQRMAALAALFYLLTIYFYLKARTAEFMTKRAVFFSLAFLSTFCAFASKENAFMLPVAIGVFDLVLIQGLGRFGVRKYLIILGIPFLFLLAAAIHFIDFTTIAQSYEGRPFTLFERLLTQPRVIVYYLYLLAYPVTSNLTILHDVAISKSLWSPWTTVPAILTVISLVVLALKNAKKFPLAAFCLLFFFLNHLIEGSVVALELIYEHRNYLPSMFLFILPVLVWFKAYDYFSKSRLLKSLLGVLFLVVAAGHGYTTWIYNGLYRNEYAIWKDAAAKSPGLSLAHNNYGSALWESGQYEAAYSLFQKANGIDYYINIKQKGIVLYNIGYYYLTFRHDSSKAIEYFKKAHTFIEGWHQIWTSLSRAYLMVNDLKQADNIIERALKHWPDDEDLLHLRSILKFRKKDFDSAYRIARRVHLKTPESIAPLTVMGEACRKLGLLNKASSYYEKVVEYQPDNLRALMALIEIYDRTGEKRLRNQRVVDLMAVKQERDWKTLFESIADMAAVTLSSPDPGILLPIIKASLSDINREVALGNMNVIESR